MKDSGIFQESSDAEKFTSVALWNKVGERELILESTERRSRASVYGMRGQLQAVFGNTLAAGRYFTDGEEAVCLIDEKTARELFGSRDVTGREVLLDGEKMQVVGILTAATVIPAVLLIMVKERRLAGAAVLAAGVLILVVIAVQIPAGSDYLPTYWSDFDFFGELQEEKVGQIESLKAHQEFWHEEGFLRVKAVEGMKVF